MGRIYLREIATENIPHLPLNHPKGYNMFGALANLIFRKNKKTTNTEFERAICGTPLVQAGILKLWGGHESEEAMYINEGKNFALLAVKRGDFKMPDAAISILGEERANELICQAIIELTPRQ